MNWRSFMADRHRRDRIVFAITFAVIMAFLIFTSLAQSFLHSQLIDQPFSLVEIGQRMAAGFIPLVFILGLADFLGVYRPITWWSQILLTLLITLAGTSFRIVIQFWLDVYTEHTINQLALEFVVTGLAIGLGGILAVWLVRLDRKLQTSEKSLARSAAQIESALSQLSDEEVRVRRSVAEGLHGSMQQRLVLLVAEVDRLTELATNQKQDSLANGLSGIRSQIEEIRESDVRATSRMLYPEGLEISLATALRKLLSRLPLVIRTRLHVHPEVRVLDDPAEPQLKRAQRLVLMRVAEEAVTNTLKHANAQQIDIELSVVEDHTSAAAQVATGISPLVSSSAGDHKAIQITVTDDGVGFDEKAVPQSGLERMRSRIELSGGVLQVMSRPGNGTTVLCALPLQKLDSEQ